MIIMAGIGKGTLGRITGDMMTPVGLLSWLKALRCSH
jgi:hypothetical protein